MLSWFNSINTTNFRILASVLFAAVWGTMIVVALVFFNWQPSSTQLKVLLGLAIVLLTMMGFDVIQFASKRFSDSGYTAVKNISSAMHASAEHPVKPQNG